MLIFKISQNSLRKASTTYSCAIVIAISPEEARLIHPESDLIWNAVLNKWCYADDVDMPTWIDSWVNPNEVEVELIGVAHQQNNRILCACFHT